MFETKMIPGQTPYTPEEWETVRKLIHEAAIADEQIDPNELEQPPTTLQALQHHLNHHYPQTTFHIYTINNNQLQTLTDHQHTIEITPNPNNTLRINTYHKHGTITPPDTIIDLHHPQSIQKLHQTIQTLTTHKYKP